MQNENDLDNATGKNHGGKKANEPVRILTAKSILGDKVLNSSGEDLGRIEDIMLSLDNGTIEYVVIAFGGFVGLGAKYFAVPFGELLVDPENHAFILERSRSEFEESPGFNRKHWPDANFHSQFSGNYGGFMGANTGADH